ncbi:MAG: Uma2 family endonuclease [Chloroflexi bacterium]|nr:Uma2 family endonuclease [Chloroflexota bacterium]MCC6894517.1 Uma2 family endonuclease [Anaerolineae bacterium]
MSSLPKQRFTEEEYLAFERASSEKHELIDGEIVAMTGASERHNLIMASTLGSLLGQSRKKPCKVYPSDMRVRISRRQYAYPDITVVCGASVLADDDYHDTLLNPTLIIEVLSPSTEGYDRGDKFTLYRTIPSLQEYVLIAQNRIQIERFVRQPDGQWLLADIKSLDSSLELNSIGCTLLAGDVYEQVSFENVVDDET